jgi:hypothetical protein
MANEGTVQSALNTADAKKLPQVEPYYDKVYQRSFFERWNGYVTGIVVGGIIGAVIGVGAAFIAPVVGAAALPTLAVLGQSAGLFAALGAVTGTLVGTQVGGTAGAVAAGFEEYERRAKLEKLREKNPALAAEIEKANQAASPEQPKTTWQKITSIFNRWENWKLFAVGALGGAAVGAVFGLSPLTSFAFEQAPSIFPMAGEAGRVLTMAGIGSLFGGSMLGFRGAFVTNAVGNSMRNLTSGKALEEPGKAQEVAKTRDNAEALSLQELSDRNFGKMVTDRRLLAQESEIQRQS